MWGYGYSDFRYIKSIQSKYGKLPLKTYPHYSLPKLYYYMKMKKIQLTPILDYIDYQKDEAMNIIQTKLGWVYYGGKHYESIYTRFFQSYILPRKFNIDKRRAHYSNLVLSEQLTREQALKLMLEPIFPEQGLAEDQEYIIKKLGLNEDAFEKLMSSSPRSFLEFPNSYKITNIAKKYIK